MTRTNFLTKEWFNKLVNELKELKEVKLPAVLERLKDAIAQWDISENAEHETALAEKDLLEARIIEIEDLISDVEIIDKVDSSWEVKYWSKVTLKDEKWKEISYTIVWSWEVDIFEWTISFQSPMWTALKWKKVWDVINIRAPKWKYQVTITGIN
jgi:transcription elongation factor GreA